jgi:hypothetical protein
MTTNRFIPVILSRERGLALAAWQTPNFMVLSALP